MLKLYVCLLAGLLGLSASAQQPSPGTNAAPSGVTNAAPVTPDDGTASAAFNGQRELVWLGDRTPDGASLSAAPDDPWVWTNAFWNGSELVGPYSGSLMHLSPPSPGWHQHSFSLPGLKLLVEPADSLFTYICLPLTDAPATVMLEWLAGDTNGSASGSWGHRAFWGGPEHPDQ
ncbi:MAG TPA: hypothetical protein VN829_04535 [Dongiaceae bacterium]|nr:hypothetical protein [Dongiaceae bacterium]